MKQKEINDIFVQCKQLLSDLPEAWQVDERIWLKRLNNKHKNNQPIDRSLQKCYKSLQSKGSRWKRRLAELPETNLNRNLPIFDYRDELVAAIKAHQVIVVAGETGSGKTTQLPQLALIAGQGRAGVIGHTQPRRIAARSVSMRIADELKESIGKKVGYQVRFDNQFNKDGYIKLMTDGVLLNEFHDDPELRNYDTLIIDEAHERSLNIDFILGLLKNLLPKRPDLKVIITSATIDLERFSSYFHNAPVIQVSGRTYPVECRYRTELEYPDADTFEAFATSAVRELVKEGPGDILVFLPTEQAIRHLADYLRRHLPKVGEILPLYSRLSQAQQNAIFKPGAKRRIVLSTNIAETSLTVPGIRYVIDSGLARISRYSTHNKVQRLPIETISQASANQRMGRCGRLENGICIRLFAEDDFISRKEFIEPEIIRTNLAAVILQMLVLEIGEIENFDFIEAPEQKQINDGLQLLIELGAITRAKKLTTLGKTLARLPLDPRLGRILIAAAKNNCLKEVSILTAAIGLPDPRERPAESQQKADQLHQRFVDIRSDFIGLYKLWDYFNELVENNSWSKVKKQCQKEFIHFNRMREWREQVGQLKQILKGLNYKQNTQSADYESIHKALLSGFITQIANQEQQNDYLAPRQTRVKIFPGSGLFKKQLKKVAADTSDKKHAIKWIVAAEIVQTSQNYARLVASIKPEWIEQIGHDLLKIQYSEPFWSKKGGRAMQRESGLLYGLAIYSGRNKSLAETEPELAREFFIKEGLIERSLNTRCQALINNWDVYDKALQMEEMGRVKGMLVDKQWFIDFYNEQLPKKVHNLAAFEFWFKGLSKKAKQKLTYQLEDICQEELQSQTNEFPDTLLFNELPLKVEYVYKPGTEEDGMHIHVPLMLLSQISLSSFQWLVPGYFEAKVIALIRGLPKVIRKNFVPVPEYSQAIIERLSYGQGDLLHDMAKHMTQMSGTVITADILSEVDLPAKYQPILVIHDESDKPLYRSRDIDLLKKKCSGEIKETLKPENTPEIITRFPDTGIKATVSLTQGHTKVSVYQGLQQINDGYVVKRFEQEEFALNAHRDSIMQLIIENNAKLNKEIKNYFDNLHEIDLRYATLPNSPFELSINASGLFDDLLVFQTQEILATDGLPYNIKDFEQLNAKLCATIINAIDVIASPLEQLFQQAMSIRKLVDKPKDLRLLAIASDIKARLDDMMFKGFIHASGEEMLRCYPRYLKALMARLETAQEKPQRERQNMLIWQKYWTRFSDLPPNKQSQSLRMTLEEFHVALFAQQLGTKIKVSEKRLNELFDALN